jgi:hypothetical protein
LYYPIRCTSANTSFGIIFYQDNKNSSLAKSFAKKLLPLWKRHAADKESPLYAGFRKQYL